MITRSEYGHPYGAANLVLTLAQVKALDVSDNVAGEEILVAGNRYLYHATSVLTADDLFVIAPGSSQAGRYLLAPGCAFDLALAITFATADAAVLATVPTAALVMGGRSYWEPVTDWSGGSSSAIGLSSSATGFSTKGDLLGGASGDVAATLVASAVIAPGTVGAKSSSILKAASTIRFDRITSVFTAGTGNAHFCGFMLKNPGA